MHNPSLFSYFKGKLVKTMLLALFFALVLFMLLSITLTKSGINQLEEEISSDLSAGQQNIQTALDSSLEQISTSVDKAKNNTSQTLSAFLSARLKETSVKTEQDLRSALLKNGEVLADTLSRVSIETILSHKFSTLVSYVKVANKDPNVIYAYFVRPNGKPFTRYVNRNNPKVKELLSIGKGRSPLDKLLEAADKDKNIVHISRPVEFEGQLVATIKVGLSIAQVNEKIQQLVVDFDTLVNDSNTKINHVLDQESQTMLNSLKSGFSQVNQENETSTHHVLTKVEQSSSDLLATLSIMMIIGTLLVLILISLFFILKIIRPIHKLNVAMKELGEGSGNLSFRLPEHGNNELSKLAIGFNQFVNKIESLVAELAVKTSSLDELVIYVSDSAQHSSAGMTKQQQETNQVISTVNNLTSLVNDVTEKTALAAESAKDADKLAEQSINVVNKTVEQIKALAQAVEKAGQVVQRVEEDTNLISTVLDVIRGIAEQTNLLALNAAIEAARAGEQGRGFAVVADEVRTLAQRSHESTEEIQDMINNLQAGVNEAVKVMSESQSHAIEGVSDAKQTGNTLAEIKKSIDMISDMNTQIAEASTQQQSLTEEVNQGMINIGEVAQLTTQDAEATSTASHNMARMVEQLTLLVNSFDMEDNILFELENAKAKLTGWKERLNQFLQGYGSMDASEALNHHNCNFGKWYYSSGIKKYSQYPQMQEIEAPHKEMHELIHKIIALQESGQSNEAKAEMSDIEIRTNKILNLIEQIEAQVK